MLGWNNSTIWWHCVSGGTVCLVALCTWWHCVLGGTVCLVALCIWWHCVLGGTVWPGQAKTSGAASVTACTPCPLQVACVHVAMHTSAMTLLWKVHLDPRLQILKQHCAASDTLCT